VGHNRAGSDLPIPKRPAQQTSRTVSCVRYTSPMPPLPIGATISYGPSLSPGESAICLSELSLADQIEDKSWMTGNSEVEKLRPTQTSSSSSQNWLIPWPLATQHFSLPTSLQIETDALQTTGSTKPSFMWPIRLEKCHPKRCLMTHDNITDISTYLRLCGRPHKRR
jgi:hypothetical protein